MENSIIHVQSSERLIEAHVITIEQFYRRRIQRRRRVAKRKLAQVPLFAVEEMQAEFPGYTYEEFVADVTRKTRKGKSFRRPKPKAFDWETIRKEVPDFFQVCIERRKTRAVLHGKLKDGGKFTCIVRSVWFEDQGQRILRTHELIALWRGPLKTFVSHPAMILKTHQNEINL